MNRIVTIVLNLQQYYILLITYLVIRGLSADLFVGDINLILHIWTLIGGVIIASALIIMIMRKSTSFERHTTLIILGLITSVVIVELMVLGTASGF